MSLLKKGGGIKSTYFDRALIKSMFLSGDVSFLGYTQGIEAEEIGYFRSKTQEKLMLQTMLLRKHSKDV